MSHTGPGANREQAGINTYRPVPKQAVMFR